MPRFPRLAAAILTALPAFAGLVAGPEHPVTTPVDGPAALDQSEARIASDGDGFLVVFTNAANVDAIRLSRDRKRIGDRPLVVAGSDRYEAGPDAAWGRDRYLVVWRGEAGVGGRMVAGDGAMGEAFTIASEVPEHVRVAFNGEVFLVVWSSGAVRRAHGAIVSVDGDILSTIDIAPTNWFPSVTAAGGAFFVATSAEDLSLTRVDGDGTVHAPLALVSERVFNYDVAAHGNDVVVAWNRGITSEASPIEGMVVSSTPGFDPEPFEAGPGTLRTLVTDRHGAVLVYNATNDYARRVGSTQVHLLARSGVTAGVSNGTDVVFATEVRTFDADLYAQTLGRAELELLTLAAPFQYWPEIAAAGDASCTVWTEWIPGERRYALLAKVNDHDAVELPATSPNLRRVATNGSQFLVVWFESYSIRGVRLSLSGDLLDRQPFLIAANVFAGHDVAWHGSSYVVAFTRGVASKFYVAATVTAVPVSPDGTIGNEVELSPKGNVWSPTVAGGGGMAVIGWYAQGLGSTMQGVLLAAGGTITPLTFPTESITGSPTAARGEGAFVVAAQFRESVRWFRVSDSGVVIAAPATAAVPLPPPANWQRSLDLSPFGARFILLVDGHAAILDPRGWTSELIDLAPDRNARVSESFLTYARPIDPAWPNITRVFVRRLTLAPDAPRRRSVR